MKKSEFYQQIVEQSQAIIAGETDVIANMANISALLFDALQDVNWVGFYRLIDEQLVLGPFQGKVACIRIALAKGVCGNAAASGEIQRVADVHQVAGHIACDAATNAEIVLPIKVQGKVVAVLDLDSVKFSRFDQDDQEGLQKIVQALENQWVVS
jgi:L-methionine (R)-S-oxide reductase